jgi:hypothetical protein
MNTQINFKLITGVVHQAIMLAPTDMHLYLVAPAFLNLQMRSPHAHCFDSACSIHLHGPLAVPTLFDLVSGYPGLHHPNCGLQMLHTISPFALEDF